MPAVISAGLMVMIMKTLNIQNLTLEAGNPAICVPLTPRNESEMKQQLEVIRQQQDAVDLLEWRADYWKEDLAAGIAAVCELCHSVRKPLIFTIRTAEEGGERAYTAEEYEASIRQSMAQDGFALYDLQLEFVKREYPRMSALIDDLHNRKKGVILSYHDFHATPAEEQMLKILGEAEKLGADIVKLAVMPQDEGDCERLMAISRTFVQSHDTLAITISMGELGVKSRILGRDTGSCISFAAGSASSAPGQLPAAALRKLLDSNSHDQ